jgi:hypothetical protein
MTQRGAAARHPQSSRRTTSRAPTGPTRCRRASYPWAARCPPQKSMSWSPPLRRKSQRVNDMIQAGCGVRMPPSRATPATPCSRASRYGKDPPFGVQGGRSGQVRDHHRWIRPAPRTGSSCGWAATTSRTTRSCATTKGACSSTTGTCTTPASTTGFEQGRVAVGTGAMVAPEPPSGCETAVPYQRHRHDLGARVSWQWPFLTTQRDSWHSRRPCRTATGPTNRPSYDASDANHTDHNLVTVRRCAESQARRSGLRCPHHPIGGFPEHTTES